MLKLNQKKLISILLAGFTIVSGEYYMLTCKNKADNSIVEETLIRNKYVVDNGDGNGLLSTLNSFNLIPVYKEKVNSLMVENDERNIQPLSENKLETGVLIKNIDVDTNTLVSNTLFKITNEKGEVAEYVKYENDPLVVYLKEGDYNLFQVNHNISYLPNDESIPFKVSKDKITQVIFENAKSKSGAILKCVDSATLENIKNIYASIIDEDGNTFRYVTTIDPYRVVLAPGNYTIVFDDMSGEYNYQQVFSYFEIKENQFEELEFKFSNEKVKTKVK